MSNIFHIFSEIRATLKSRLILIVVVSLLAGTLVAIFSHSVKGIYSTHSEIFPLSINKGGGGSSPMNDIRSQLGIGDKADFEKIYNVKELVNSKTVSMSIVKSVPKNHTYKSLAAWLIDDYNKNLPFWKSKILIAEKDTDDIYFTGADLLLANTTVEENKAGFTLINNTAHNVDLLVEMNETILRELSAFYIKMETEKPRSDLSKIKLMRDSLKQELVNTERAIAGFIDANQLSVKSTTQLPQNTLTRNLQEIQQLYSVTATSYQNAKFKLLSESPIFQVLDYAGPPFGFTQPNWKKYSLMAFCGAFFFMSLFVCRKIFWGIIMEELSKV